VELVVGELELSVVELVVIVEGGPKVVVKVEV
jgi:hypothetical protein